MDERLDLLVAVLLSGLAARSVLSTSLLFLLGGALVGDGALGMVHIAPNSPIVATTADLALFTVLFTDGQHVSLPSLRTAWRNPVRALGVGMPLAFAGMALITHLLVGLDWTTSFLVGAVLAPTDPVFASAIVGRREVPARLRQLLNVESGLNDGLALPIVLLLIAMAGPTAGTADASVSKIALELVGGLALGVVLPLAVALLARLPLLGAEPKLQPLLPLATGVSLYAAGASSQPGPRPTSRSSSTSKASTTADASRSASATSARSSTRRSTTPTRQRPNR